MDSKEYSIDELFEMIDECAQKLESGEISLEQSVEIYRKGMALIKKCNESIDKIEKKVKLINAEGTEIESEESKDD